MLGSSLDGSMGSYDKIIKSSSSDKWRWVKPSLCALAALGLVATAFGGIALGLPNSAIGQALSDRNIRIILTGVGGAAVTGAVAGRILTQHFQGKQPYRETDVVREESLIPDTPSLPVPGTGYRVADPRARSDLIGYESITPTKKRDKRNPRTLIKERLEAAMNAKKEIFTFATGSSVHEEYGLIGRTIMHEIGRASCRERV